MSARTQVARAAHWLARARRRRRPALSRSYEAARASIPFVERLSDEQLDVLNDLLPWHSFTVDSRGRPFGGTAWAGKRVEPEPVPDRRIVSFDERFGLADGQVLEIGCFEGVHTAALCAVAGRVIAVDARVENVVKTIVRCAFYGHSPVVLTADVEQIAVEDESLHADLCHHVGVLYHLADPVRHLRRLGVWVERGLMLDTHYANESDVDGEYEVDGRRYRYRRFLESGRADPFSGVQAHAKWLLLHDITAELGRAGFGRIEVVEQRNERNGPRVLLFAERADR